MTEKTRRRWFAFRLRTLLVAVAVLGLPLAWVGHSLNWIAQRRSALAERWDGPPPGGAFGRALLIGGRAPGGLWLFGEVGMELIAVPPERIADARRLFPEAKVSEGRRP